MKLPDETQAMRKPFRLIVGLLSLLLMLWLAAGFAMTHELGRSQQRPLRKDQLIQALRIGGVSSGEYVARIHARGVDFELTQANEKELRAAGASSAVIEAIRANYRQPTPRQTTIPVPKPSNTANSTNNTNPIPAAKPSAKELIQRSYNLWRACDYDQAINLATEGINAESRSAEGYTIRGAAYLFKLELASAISDLSEAIRLQPDNALALRWRAMAYQGRLSQGDSSPSLGKKDVESVLQLIVNPKEAWEYEARGYAHFEKEEYDLAISDLDEAIRLDPQYLSAYVIRGATRNWKLGGSLDNLSSDIGIKDMSEAIQRNPKLIGGYFYRGLYLFYGNRKEASIADFSEAIRLSPKGIIAYSLRGLAYDSQKQYDLAIKDYSEVIGLGARTYFRWRAQAYSSKGDYESALRDYTEYINYYPEDSSGYASRAEVYRKLGRTAQAEADKKKADELNKKK